MNLLRYSVQHDLLAAMQKKKHCYLDFSVYSSNFIKLKLTATHRGKNVRDGMIKQ